MSGLRITEPLTLKCGLTLPNRLCKAATGEGLGDKDQLPNKKHLALYGTWADGGWGMVLTGNVMVDIIHMGSPNDVAIDDDLPAETTLSAFRAYAQACNRANTPTIVQICHPGRQSPMGAGRRGLMAKTVAPSAVPMKLGPGLLAWAAGALMFGTPRALEVNEIEAIVAKFARTARITAEAGFAGVELHGAHGFLLAQFLSAQSNRRTDAYGGSAAKRAKIVVDVIKAVRAATPKGFCVGIKLNSVDHQEGAELDACIEQLRLITDAGVDFVEISGGSYEDPPMANGSAKKSARTQAREAFYLEFASRIRSQFPGVHLMVTGGFRSRNGLEAAVTSGDCDLVGIARPAIINPSLPKNIVFNPEVKDQDATLFRKTVPIPWLLRQLSSIRFVGAGVDNVWYQGNIKDTVNAVLAGLPKTVVTA
ncbi:NADH:flavin oxidoreductase/NADH oxidase [Podospora appendiculata]|uniref:NADH:flavin oxidoreductase/NADH oxidase n=1 Tax=Podospora appendiculata TaxID=314037 RepID=A0AAE0X6P6_9PEZI|nr:NADH:flavin oxidoreductase/NADH oxidase [Podospora appendiculata]